MFINQNYRSIIKKNFERFFVTFLTDAITKLFNLDNLFVRIKENYRNHGFQLKKVHPF